MSSPAVVVEPEIAWSENRSFPVPDGPVGGYPNRSHWSYPWVQGVIDWPMRFGSEAFVSASLGQSHVEARAWGARAGVSNENLWIGPARRYPLLLGNNAPGFPHLYVETSTPLSTPVGELRVGAFWGMLEESDYFFSTSPRNRRILTVLHGSWSVPFLEGLDVGATAMLQENVEAGLDLSYLTTIFAASPHQSSRIDPADGRGNVHARWRFPDPGFEVYGEWGFNDFWGSMDDFLGEPDHLIDGLFAGELHHHVVHQIDHLFRRLVGAGLTQLVHHHRYHDIGPAFAHQAQCAVEIEEDVLRRFSQIDLANNFDV